MSEAVLTASPVEVSDKKGSVLGGTAILAGTAIGAGMFSLPIATSGVWFGYSLLLMVVVWYFMYSSSLYLLEANLRFPLGASFDTIADGTIGRVGRVINGGSIAFLCYILIYAYISGGSSVISHTMSAFGVTGISQPVASLVFAGVLSAIVIGGANVVDKVSTALIGGMIITFLGSTSGMVSQAQMVNLFPDLTSSDTLPYAFGAVSVLVVSFGMQSSIPSMTKYLEKDGKRLRQSILIGSLLTLAFYALWQFSVLGNISREQFPALIAQGGNIGNIIAALEENGLQGNMSVLLQLFSNMAVASSFLGVALCLFDYISDLFGFGDDLAGKAKTSVITFVPPTLLGAFLPNGFIVAIVYAGLASVLYSLLTPIMMAYAGRKQGAEGYRVYGGTPHMVLVFGFGVLAIILAILDLMGALPAYG